MPERCRFPQCLLSKYSAIALLAFAGAARGAEPTSSETAADADAVPAGHSYHGEAFNEGPRQAAVIMPGMAAIDFPTSTKNEQAQAFIEQGIAQLHGFWYLEAERSFRQASKLDPDLAIAYWGMAMANVNNLERARGLIDEAKEKSKKNASKRERLYIDALERFIPKSESDDDDEPETETETEAEQKQRRDQEREERKRRGERYVADLEKILHEYPDDVEAKAFLALQLWMGDRQGVKLTSRYAVEALLGQVFDANPDHPAHHYRIHLWDYARPENALVSAAKCGPSSPGIAHMWHMPGHIYSKLKRYSDAAWQQEASARVDHSHMIRTRLMPDQIHNFAHNNEWLVRNLVNVGRVADAIDLAQNLVSLPQHPAYNSLDKRGSHKYGRQRLVQVISRYGLWDQLVEEMGGRFLPPTDHESTRRDELGWLGVAQFMSGDAESGSATLRKLKRIRLDLQSESLDIADGKGKSDGESEDDESKSPKQLRREIESLRPIISRVAAAAAAKRNDRDAFKRHAKRARLDRQIEARWLAKVGELNEAIRLAERAVRDGQAEVLPLAVLVDLLWSDGKKDRAKEEFAKLRKVAGVADLETPLLAKLKPVAEAVQAGDDWRLPPEPAEDLGQRPPLDKLGPFRWQPYQSESWEVQTADGEWVSDADFGTGAKLVVFYLGAGCLHCVEQIHEFDPAVEKFRAAGIEMIGISTEDPEQLTTGIKTFDRDLNLTLLADADQDIFKRYRCWDDFEGQPLHGTFLIDSTGRVRWQDISYEPFMDVDFLLKESKRLLDLP